MILMAFADFFALKIQLFFYIKKFFYIFLFDFLLLMENRIDSKRIYEKIPTGIAIAIPISTDILVVIMF